MLSPPHPEAVHRRADGDPGAGPGAEPIGGPVTEPIAGRAPLTAGRRLATATAPVLALATALASLSAFGLTALFFVRTPYGQRLDGLLLPRAEWGGGYEQRSVLAGPARELLAVFGRPSIIGTLLVGLLLVAVLTRRTWLGVAGVASVLCAAALTEATKTLLVRPDFAVSTSTTHNSFPSGHVTVAMALLLAFLLVVPDRLRWWLAVPGAAAVAAVGAATMIVGWHRFSDVLGSVLLAAAVCGLLAALERTPPEQVPPEQAPPERALWEQTLVERAVALGVGLAGLSLGLLVAPTAMFDLPKGPLVAILAESGLVLFITVLLLCLMPSAFPSTRWSSGQRPPGTPVSRPGT